MIEIRALFYGGLTLHLALHEVDKLTIVSTGLLAQRRLTRGVRLGYPEAVADLPRLVGAYPRRSSFRSGADDVRQDAARQTEVLPGVSEMVGDSIEGTFPDGTKLFAVRAPITAEEGNLELAMYG